MIDRRRAVLIAGLAAVRVKSREPALLAVHAWLDSWDGVGLIVVISVALNAPRGDSVAVGPEDSLRRAA